MLVLRSPTWTLVLFLFAVGAVVCGERSALAASLRPPTPLAGQQEGLDNRARDWRIVDGVGAPLAGVRVDVSWQVVGEDAHDVELVSDAEGRLRFPAGDAGPPDGARLRRLEPESPLTRVALHGTRLDGPLGDHAVLVAEPLAEVRVRVPGVSSLAVSLAVPPEAGAARDHRFDLPEPVVSESVEGDAVRLRVPPGSYQVTLSMDGSLEHLWVRGEHGVTLTVEGGASLELELPEPRWTLAMLVLLGSTDTEEGVSVVGSYASSEGPRACRLDPGELTGAVAVAGVPAGGVEDYHTAQVHARATTKAGARLAHVTTSSIVPDSPLPHVAAHLSSVISEDRRVVWGELEVDRAWLAPLRPFAEERVHWEPGAGEPELCVPRYWVHRARVEWGGERDLEHVAWMGVPDADPLDLTAGLEWHDLELDVPSDGPWLLVAEQGRGFFDTFQVLRASGGRLEARVLGLPRGAGREFLRPCGSEVGEAVVGSWRLTRLRNRTLARGLDRAVEQRVRCVGARSGEPVPFAPVRVHLEGHGFRRFCADERGELRLVLPPGRACRLAPGVGAEGWTLHLDPSDEEEPGSRVLHVPERANSVTLRTSEDPGRAETAARLVGSGQDHGRPVLFDSAGRAHLRGVVPGEYELLLPLDSVHASDAGARRVPIVVPEGDAVEVEVAWP